MTPSCDKRLTILQKQSEKSVKMIFFNYLCNIFVYGMKQGLFILTLSVCLFAACSHQKQAPQTAKYESIDTLPMLIMQVQQCSRLYTAEYRIHKIVTHDDVLRLKGNFLGKDINMRMPMGDRKIAIPMDATLKAYIDFEDFSEKNISRDGKKITIYLPDPKVMLTSSKINQRHIKEYVGLTRSHFTDAEMTAYEQQGREAIIASIPDLGIIDTAKESAARVLIPLIEQMGFRQQDITVAFRHDYGIGDLKALLDTSAIEQQ